MEKGWEKMIVEYLPQGKANAISTHELCQLTGVRDVRKLRSIVAAARNAGEIIASSSAGGYFIPADNNELEEFIRTLDSKARSIMVALQSARKVLKTSEASGQISIAEMISPEERA